MKKNFGRVTAMAFALVMGAGVTTAVHAADTGVIATDGSAKVESIQTTVLAVDATAHTVTIAGPQNQPLTYQLGPNTKALTKLKAGDTVTISLIQSIGVELLKAGSGEPSAEIEQQGVRSKPGQMPAGAAVRSLIVTGKITGVDLKTHKVTIEGPNGKLRTIDVKDHANQAKLKDIKVGDLLKVTLTEGIAISTAAPAKN